jgi:hypothetical protein
MSAGVMEDYKLRDLRTSHTLYVYMTVEIPLTSLHPPRPYASC